MTSVPHPSTVNPPSDRDLIEFGSALCLNDAAALTRLFTLHPGSALLDHAPLIFSGRVNILWINELCRLLISARDRGAIPLEGADSAIASSSLRTVEGLLTTPSFGARDPEATAAMLSLIDAHGGFALGSRSTRLASAAIANKDVECLAWLAERGLWRASSHGTHFQTSAVAAFSPESDHTIARLSRLCDAGALVDADGALGLTDFLARGLHRSAMALSSKGFKPRPQVLLGPSNCQGATPVCAYLIGLSERSFATDKHVREAAIDAVECLQWLAAQGADFAPPKGSFPHGSRLHGLAAAAILYDPFCAASLLMERRRRAGCASRAPLAAMILKALRSLGANPNLTGQFLVAEIQDLDYENLNAANFQAALEAGANPSLHPGKVLAAPARWRIHTSHAPAWFDKLAALGADPRAISSTCGQSDHPLACALSHRAIAYASHALAAGVSPAWRSSSTGETLWHLLAEQETKAALDFSRKLGAIPEAAALIDRPFSSTPDAPEGLLQGTTPLHLACSSLNLGQARILLGLGANPNLQDGAGQSALHCAGRKFGAKALKKTAPLIELLMSHGADPSLLNSDGLTAAQAMAKRSPLDGLAILLRARPEDLASGDKASAAAQRAIAKRGAQAHSIIDEAVLRAEGSVSTPANLPSKKVRL